MIFLSNSLTVISLSYDNIHCPNVVVVVVGAAAAAAAAVVSSICYVFVVEATGRKLTLTSKLISSGPNRTEPNRIESNLSKGKRTTSGEKFATLPKFPSFPRVIIMRHLLSTAAAAGYSFVCYSFSCDTWTWLWACSLQLSIIVCLGWSC